MSSEPTVEECLRELREFWPRSGWLELQIDNHDPRYAVSWFRPALINGVLWDGAHWKRASDNVLSKVMDQVRQWHRENKQ